MLRALLRDSGDKRALRLQQQYMMCNSAQDVAAAEAPTSSACQAMQTTPTTMQVTSIAKHQTIKWHTQWT
jgi:hypothetical protein